MSDPVNKIASRWIDAIRAENNGTSLVEDNQGNLVVLAERKDGSRYKLGHISQFLVLQDPEHARAAIDRIRFHV